MINPYCKHQRRSDGHHNVGNSKEDDDNNYQWKVVRTSAKFGDHSYEPFKIDEAAQ